MRAVSVLSVRSESVWAELEGVDMLQALMPHLGCQAAAQLEDPALLDALVDLTGTVPTGSLAWYRGAHPLEGIPWKL